MIVVHLLQFIFYIQLVDMHNTKICFQKEYPSQTIFIDGVFYNDFRSKNAIDYSTVLIEWAKNNNIGEFTTAEMDKVS